MRDVYLPCVYYVAIRDLRNIRLTKPKWVMLIINGLDLAHNEESWLWVKGCTLGKWFQYLAKPVIFKSLNITYYCQKISFSDIVENNIQGISLSFSLSPSISISACVVFFFSTQAQVETRILGLIFIVLRDWAWFTAAKLGWFRTRWCTEHKSYNTYMLTYRKYMHWIVRNSKGTKW